MAARGRVPLLLGWGALLWGLLFLAAPAWGARATLEMDVQRLQVGQSAVLRVVVVDGVAASVPQLAEPDGLHIAYQRQSSSRMMINFKTTSSVTYSFSVSALKEGDYRIGPATCMVGGRSITTGSLALSVEARAPGTDAALTVSAGLLPDMPVDAQGRIPLWVGQTVVFRFVFRHQDPILDARWSAPDFPGLRPEPTTEQAQREYQVQEGPITWTVHEILVPLVVTTAGEGEIPAAVLTVQIADAQRQRRRRSVLDDFFEPGFYTQTHTETLATAPLRFVARDLPSEGRPASFAGLVGRFQASGGLAAGVVSTGDSLTQTVQIIGDSSLAGVRLPAAAASDAFRVYDDEPEVQTEVQQGFRSHATLRRALVPLRPGDWTVPGISLSWFDPLEGRYREQVVGEEALSVAATDGEELEMTSWAASPGVRQDEVASLADDILPIHTDVRPSSKVFRPSNPLYLVLVGAPGFTLLGLLLLDLRRRGGRRGERLRALRGLLAALPVEPLDRLASLEAAFREVIALTAGVKPAAVDSALLRRVFSGGQANFVEGLYRRLEKARFGGRADDALEHDVLDWVQGRLRRLS